MGTPGTVTWDDEGSPVTWDEAPPAPAPTPAPRVTRIAAPEQRMDLPDDARVIERGINASAPPDAMTAFALGLRNPFNMSDEIAKGASKAADLYTGHQQTPRTVGKGINAPLDTRSDAQIAVDEEKFRQRQGEAAHPYLQAAGKGTTEAALIALASSLGGAAAAPAPTMAGRAIQAAKVAAPVGAISGYGGSESPTLGGQLADTAIGAGTAALAGPVVGEVTHQGLNLRLPQRAAAAVQRGSQNMVNRRAAATIETEHGPELAAFAREVANPAAEGEATRAAMYAGTSPEAIASHAKNLEQNVTQISKAGDTIQAAETIAKKARLAGMMMREDQIDPTSAVQATDQSIQDLAQQVADWKKNTVPGTKDHNFLTRIDRTIQQYQLQADPAALATTPDPYALASQRFALADQVKREMQQAIENADRSSPAIESMNEAEKGLRGHLEDPELWGPTTGAMQSSRNTAWHDYLNLNTRDVSPKTAFLTDYLGQPSKRENAYRPLLTGDEQKLANIAKNAGTGTPEEWKLREWGPRAANLGQALTEHPVAPDEALSALAQSQQTAAGNINTTLDQRIAEKAAADKLEQIKGTSEGAPGLLRSVINRAPAYLELGGGTALAGGVYTGHPAAEAGGMGAMALGLGAQKLKNFVEQGTPEALAGRATELANLEAQAPNNPAAKAALDKLRGTIQPLGSAAGTAERTAGAVVGASAGQFSGDQLSNALKQWANTEGRDKGEGQTKGHDLENSVKYALQKQPALLGPYAGIFSKPDANIPMELLRLQGDPKWVRDVLPHLQQLTK